MAPINSMKNKITFEIGLSDGEIDRYQRESDLVTIVITAWNGRTITVIFSGVAGVLDYGIGDISDFIEETEETEFLTETLSRVYDKTPDYHPYRIYQFLNLDDAPSLEILAESMEITA